MASYRVSNLGKFLRPFREQRGISTAKEFGDLTGIRRTHLSEIENGRRNLTDKMAARIAEAIGMTPEELRERLVALANSEAASETRLLAIPAEPSPGLREEPRVYGRVISKAPDSDALLRHLVGKMSREDQFALLRELTDAGEAGDLSAVPKARALLEAMQPVHEAGTHAG